MITKKTKYALKALASLAEGYEHKKPILISELAEKDRIPKKFLEMILLELKNKGILHSKKGKGGGYFLAKKPDEIELITVMRILEGPLAPLPCLSQTAHKKCDECDNEVTCGIRSLMKGVYEAQLRALEKLTLQDLLDKHRPLAGVEMYHI